MELLSNSAFWGFLGTIATIIAPFAAPFAVNRYKNNNKNKEKITDLEAKWNSAELVEYRNSVGKCIKNIIEVCEKQPFNHNFALSTINQNRDEIKNIIEFLHEFKISYTNNLRKKDFAKTVFSKANEILNSKVSNTIKVSIYDNEKEYFDDLARFYKNNQ